MEPNPVGVSHIHLLDKNITKVIEDWNQENPSPSWWGRLKGQWIKAVSYLISAIDYFIDSIDNALPHGPDKKATVMDAVTKVYDVIVPGLLPIWLKPFNKRIKQFVIHVVVSILIDFVVGKNRGQSFRFK